jgi:D-alanyl-D-alanine dipeptidase
MILLNRKMKIMNKKLVLLIALIYSLPAAALAQLAREKGFVYLHEIDPTIQSSFRYLTHENFLGTPVDGYKKPVVILTKQAALALKKVQEEVKKDGYSLLIYDAYRPQQAVDHFVRWAAEVTDQRKKANYYPRVNKAHVFELGYVAKKSGHSRGSTVDLTLIKDRRKLHPVKQIKRTLLDNFTILFLDDGSIDMGSSFDLFDHASHTQANNLINQDYKKIRSYLQSVMEKHGFKVSPREWWHFTLVNEPYPADQESSYFNFPVE